MNKQTIQQVEQRRSKLMRRLVRTVSELDAVDKKLKKMRAGKIKVPPPPGKKVKLDRGLEGQADFDDLVPSFGAAAAIEF